MDSVTEDRHWHLAAEVAANLAEVSRWEWSEHAVTSAELARRLADGIYDGKDPADLVDVVERLSAELGNGPGEWLFGLTTSGPDGEPVPAGFSDWRADARRSFYALRAALYPDGRETGS